MEAAFQTEVSSASTGVFRRVNFGDEVKTNQQGHLYFLGLINKTNIPGKNHYLDME